MLAGQPPVPVPTDRDWSAWQLHARFQRVVPLLYELVDRVPTALSDHVRLEVRQLQADSMAWAVRVEHELLEVTARLRACGLGSVVLKGVATAHLDYPTPAWRQFGDADLLVLPDEFPNACRVISDSGWEQGYELPRHHERFTHAITFVRNGVELDLHQRIGHRAIGLLVPTAQLVRAARPFELAGTELMALSDHDRLIHAAVHAATSRGTTKRLSSTADVLLLADHHSHAAHAVLDRAGGWQLRALVGSAISSAFATARLAVPDPWVEAMGRPSRNRSRLLDLAYCSPHRSLVLEEMAYLRMLGWRDRARYLEGHLTRGPEHTPEHGRARGSQIAYLWSKVRRGGGT